MSQIEHKSQKSLFELRLNIIHAHQFLITCPDCPLSLCFHTCSLFYYSWYESVCKAWALAVLIISLMMEVWRAVACKLAVSVVLWSSLWNRADDINNLTLLGWMNFHSCVYFLIIVLSFCICSAPVISYRHVFFVSFDEIFWISVITNWSMEQESRCPSVDLFLFWAPEFFVHQIWRRTEAFFLEKQFLGLFLVFQTGGVERNDISKQGNRFVPMSGWWFLQLVLLQCLWP